jgi:phosphoribosylamine--glycine ligase
MATAPTRVRDAGVSLVMPTRILVVGGGAREHALAWKLAGEPGVNEVIVAPGSAGIATEPRVRINPAVDPSDGPALVALARAEAVELVVIGPEVALAAGVADALEAAGVPTFGPTAAAARIETSKAYCREIATAAGVRIARGAGFSLFTSAVAFAREMAADGRGVVVKADGLAAGKGVTVCDDADEAERALAALFEDDDPAFAGDRVVIEERLVGREASLIALCDGTDALGLPTARDHKRLEDGDRGPNTGGMGASSPVSDLPDAEAEELLERIHRPILAELARRGSPFRGALYAGLMLTDEGPVLLECNARFGDPETQVVLPRLAVALGPLLLAAAQGNLREAARPLRLTGSSLPVRPGAAVGVVIAASGYPATPRGGDPIDGLDAAAAAGALVFHAGTAMATDGGFVTAGGRIVTVVGQGADLDAAREHAGSAADLIRFPGALRRRDIGLDHRPIEGDPIAPAKRRVAS